MALMQSSVTNKMINKIVVCCFLAHIYLLFTHEFVGFKMSFANNPPLINSKVGMYDSVNLVEYEMRCKDVYKIFIFVIHIHKNSVIS